MSPDNFRSIIFSSGQLSKAGSLDANLVLRQNKVDLKSQFIDIKSGNPELTQKQVAHNYVFQFVHLEKLEIK